MTTDVNRWVDATTFIQGTLETDQHVRTQVCRRINEVLSAGGEIISVAESQIVVTSVATSEVLTRLSISVYYSKLGDRVPPPDQFIEQQRQQQEGTQN